MEANQACDVLEKDEVMEILDAKEEENSSLKKALANIRHKKGEVMKVLNAKDKEVEDLHAYSFEIKGELSKVKIH